MLATGQRTYALGHYWEGPEQFGTSPNSARRGAIIVRALAGRKTARTGAAGRGIPWPRPVRPIDRSDDDRGRSVPYCLLPPLLFFPHHRLGRAGWPMCKTMRRPVSEEPWTDERAGGTASVSQTSRPLTSLRPSLVCTLNFFQKNKCMYEVLNKIYL